MTDESKLVIGFMFLVFVGVIIGAYAGLTINERNNVLKTKCMEARGTWNSIFDSCMIPQKE